MEAVPFTGLTGRAGFPDAKPGIQHEHAHVMKQERSCAKVEPLLFVAQNELAALFAAQ